MYICMEASCIESSKSGILEKFPLSSDQMTLYI